MLSGCAMLFVSLKGRGLVSPGGGPDRRGGPVNSGRGLSSLRGGVNSPGASVGSRRVGSVNPGEGLDNPGDGPDSGRGLNSLGGVLNICGRACVSFPLGFSTLLEDLAAVGVQSFLTLSSKSDGLAGPVVDVQGIPLSSDVLSLLSLPLSDPPSSMLSVGVGISSGLMSIGTDGGYSTSPA